MKRIPKTCLLALLVITSCKNLNYEYVFVSNRDGNMDIYYSSHNNTLKKLTNDKDVEYGFSWNADGTKMVFAKEIKKQYDLFLFDRNDSSITQLTNDSMNQYGPRFAPVKNQICFVSNDKNSQYEIISMNIDSMKEKMITNNRKMNSSPTFHPDGKRIFYTSFMNKDSLKGFSNSEIFVTDTSGSFHIRLSNNSGNDGALDISPDGKKNCLPLFFKW